MCTVLGMEKPTALNMLGQHSTNWFLCICVCERPHPQPPCLFGLVELALPLPLGFLLTVTRRRPSGARCCAQSFPSLCANPLGTQKRLCSKTHHKVIGFLSNRLKVTWELHERFDKCMLEEDGGVGWEAVCDLGRMKLWEGE